MEGIAGAEGLTNREVLEEIGRGGKFAIFPYAISVVILTFRRATDLRFFRAGESGAGRAWGASMTTFFLGWWGFPWGPIYSIGALFTNAMGGKDVTREMLTPLVGADRALAALKMRAKPKTGAGIWGLRAALLAVPMILLGVPVGGAYLHAKHRQRLPGYAAFQEAESRLTESADGNTPEARGAARQLKELLDQTFEAADGGKAGPKLKPVGVWCEWGEDHATVLVRMDEWGRLSEDDRKFVSDLLWKAACAHATAAPARADGRTLTLGVRGTFDWKLALAGRLPASALAEALLPEERIQGSPSEARLIAEFARHSIP